MSFGLRNVADTAAVKPRSGRRRFPTASIPREKSAGTTSTPWSANGSLEVPVPAAMSSTRSPGRASTARTTALRHNRS